MICLNNTDTLEGGASVNAVVDYTVHGLVGTSFTQIAQGQLSNTNPSVLYTAGAAISIVSVIYVNTHSAAVTVDLYLDPANAGTPRRMIPKNLSLGIGYSAHFDGQRLTIIDPGAAGGVANNYLSIAASVSSAALTVALKGEDGNDPSATNPVTIAFRDETLTIGTPNVRTVTGALSVVLASGGTLGFTAALAGRIYVWALDNAGTVMLGLSRTADIFPESNLVADPVDIGSGSDSATTMYVTTHIHNLACRCLGYIEITTGAVAGEWDNAPTKIQVMGPGVKRTGDVIQVVSTTLTTVVTLAPGQMTFGDVTGLLATIVMTSNCNKVAILASVLAGCNTPVYLAIKRDATLIAVGTGVGSRTPVGGSTGTSSTTTLQSVPMTHLDSPATAGSVVYQVQVAPASNNTVSINRLVADLNNVDYPSGASNIMVMEVMA